MQHLDPVTAIFVIIGVMSTAIAVIYAIRWFCHKMTRINELAETQKYHGERFDKYRDYTSEKLHRVCDRLDAIENKMRKPLGTG